jgi:intracellular multiplication protein IcmL
MNDNDALEVVFSRNSFYKRLHFLALAAFALSLLVIVILIWTFFYLIKNPTHPLFFATDSVGRLIQIVPVNRPNMTTDEVMAWTVEGVQRAYSYDYVNYRAQLQGAQRYFTTYGWSKYMAGLVASNNLVALTQRRMIFIAQVVDQPKLVAQGILGGSYAWKFQIPLLVTYSLPPYDDKSRFENPLQVTVVVQRQPVLQSYKGLGIVQLNANLATETSNQPQEISGTPTG